MISQKKINRNGFTLIELAVVGIFLGLLAVFAISAFNSGATNSTRAKGLADVSLKITSNWGVLVQYCNMSADISAVTLSTLSIGDISRANLAYLLGTDNSINPVYSSCLKQSGIKQLFGLSTGPAGAERVQDFLIESITTLTIGGKNCLAVTFSNVPDAIVLTAYNFLSGATNAAIANSLPTADNTDRLFRFTGVSAGTRSITIINPI